MVDEGQLYANSVNFDVRIKIKNTNLNNNLQRNLIVGVYSYLAEENDEKS